jgi:hypothetical protein
MARKLITPRCLNRHFRALRITRSLLRRWGFCEEYEIVADSENGYHALPMTCSCKWRTMSEEDLSILISDNSELLELIDQIK